MQTGSGRGASRGPRKRPRGRRLRRGEIWDMRLNPVEGSEQGGNRPALMQSWTFNIQRELPFNILLDASYIGSKSNGLWTGLEDINQVDSKYLSLGNTLNADIDSPAAAAA